MRHQFIYWLCLASGIAYGEQFLHLVAQNLEQDAPRAYVRVTQQDHSSVRQQLMYPQVNPYDYVYVQTPDGKKRLKRKVDVESYQPQFELGMLNEYVAPSKGRRWFGHDYEQSLQYFANKFAGNFAENVFHCVLNYQYPGFCKYAQQLPGFDDFILSMTDQLKAGSELQKRMEHYWGGKEAFAALQRINKAKIKEQDDRKYQVKYQAVRQLLQERDFDQLGVGILEQYKITDQFTYHGNMVQIAQLKHIAHFFNDVGTFEQALDQLSELQQIVDHAIGFGRLSNQANRSNNISLSQSCLEIGKNLLVLGKGLKNGLARNATGLYHLIRYPVDTGEGLIHLVKTIGTGIGKLVTTSLKMDVGMELGDENLIQSAQQDVDNWIDGGRQLYEVGKQTWQSKSKLERYELVGNYATDLLLLKGLPAAGKLTAVQKLAEYKPQAFAKLGEAGREINQIVGLICAKVPKYLRRSEQMVAAGEAGMAEINLIEELNIASSLLKHDAQISNSAAKISEITKIVEFETSLLVLQAEYGAEILHDAKQALRINKYKVLNNCETKILAKIEQACSDIKFVQSKPHRKNFIYDMAHEGKITERSIEEALTACAAEDAGIVKRFIRTNDKTYDFLDEFGQMWDIKSFYSEFTCTENKINTYIDMIREGLAQGEYILIDWTHSNVEAINFLKHKLDNNLKLDWKSKIFFIKR